MLGKSLVQQIGGRARAMLHANSRGSERRRASTGNPRVGVRDGINDVPYPGGDDGVGTRRSATVMAAGLQGAIKCRSVGSRTSVVQCADFRVGLPRRKGEALADHGGATHDDCPHCGVWARGPQRGLGQSYRPSHAVVGYGRGSHGLPGPEKSR